MLNVPISISCTGKLTKNKYLVISTLKPDDYFNYRKEFLKKTILGILIHTLMFLDISVNNDYNTRFLRIRFPLE